ncbi:g6242 [Coccomyxa elongata]
MPEGRYRHPSLRRRVSHSLLVLALAYLFAKQAEAITHRERTATARKIKSSHKYRASGTGAGVRHPHAAPPKEFIYIYDLPSEFNEDLKELPVQWHPEQYDYDQVLHRHFSNSVLRTDDPEKAQLFFIPVYLGRHYNWFWQQWSTPGKAWDVHKDCLPHHTPPECFWDKWDRAKQATSELVRKALAHVRERHPYWDKRNGADHFMVFSYDHGRCDMAVNLRHSEWGQMFAIQSYGDLTYTNKPEVPPLAQPWREDNYTWDGPKAWACFRPNADVLVPMYYTYAAADIVSPFAGSREITALMRFGYEIGDGKNLVEHYGHRLRYELIEYWKENPLEGSQQGLKSVEETEADMANAVFCVCAPGQTQDTVRVYRAILKGCIPVTMFRANDLPFARFLGMPYDSFMVNVQPDDYRELNSVLSRILADTARLRRMQEALEVHQRYFVWDEAEEKSIFGSIERELALRAATVNDTPRSVFS